MRLVLSIISFFIVNCVFSQETILALGNKYLNSGDLDSAEIVFRRGITSEPKNQIYQCQLGLVLINKGEYSPAENIFQTVLEIDSLNTGALWYSGIGSFKSGNDSLSIIRFEKVLTLLDETSNQYSSALWFIGKSYSKQLRTKGLSYQELNRMIACFDKYLFHENQAEDYEEIDGYLKEIKEKRPSENVKRWVHR